MNKLEGKVAIVTGASQGIGKTIVESFVAEGAQVIGVDLNKLPYKMENVEGYEVSVTDREGLKNFYNTVIAKYEKVDILVNNAGVTKDALTEKMTEQMWDFVIDVNLKGVFNLTQLVGPQMQNLGRGSIINLSSIAGIYGNLGQSNYAATKAGVIGLTKTWAKEFARKGAQVRVNAISPGTVNTDMFKAVPEKVIEEYKKKIMLRRLAEPEEIAKVAVFLASDDSSYVTAHVLNVDGGIRL
ncbi:3-oxoacyl-ACP reductase FabG [Crassaminicella profunda]|uniref:3-oxoacyl-ACP reductase FabG n=1 Tax=Crassaminicella profunda TaxID=1286698 RepID=UPI001CA6AF05|nr:3-oxoacyl-ACP reductase FabG [Crassaminicella profunda]QZY54079.1 3-oxoacyl-ACP reductase FabG [Crassaminicella profunda]